MDSKKLEILMAATDLGSFSRAAEATGYTQSGLTHMMDSLEKEIGFPLLVRSHSGISLTEQGERLMPAIRTFLQANAALETEIRAAADRQTGNIRIAAYASMALHWMPEILYRFRRECPEVTVDLRMVDHALEPFELLESGKTDVIFASFQPDRPCRWLPLYDEPLFAILPKSYPLYGRKEFPLTEFADKDFIMPYGKFDREVTAAMRLAGITLRTHQARVDDETVVRMVGRGLGVSMMGELMIRGGKEDVFCVPVSPRVYRHLGMGTSPNAAPHRSMQILERCVLQYAKEELGRKTV